MAKRIWKFVGGGKSARTSLNAAVASTIESYDGETAIYNSETGELYDRTGEKYPPVIGHQYDKVANILALIVIHARTGEEIPHRAMAGLITQIGGEMLEDITDRARVIMESIDATTETQGAPDVEGSRSS